jgi:hypothetical protein
MTISVVSALGLETLAAIAAASVSNMILLISTLFVLPLPHLNLNSRKGIGYHVGQNDSPIINSLISSQ